MTTKAADDFDYLAQRLKEIQADRDLARTGSSAPVTGQESKTEDIHTIAQQWHGWTYSDQEDADLTCLKSLAHPNWPYIGTPHEWRGFVIPDLRGRVKASG